jgi:hypothetical protein
MQALDTKLIDELVHVREEIAQTEAAAVPIDTVIVERLAEIEQAAIKFASAPFALDLNTPSAVSRQLMGALAVLMPDATRGLVEAHVRQIEERRPVLRMAPHDKAAKLAALHTKARQLEARLELARREYEAADPEVTFSRHGVDPEIWLADVGDLRAMANGRQR